VPWRPGERKSKRTRKGRAALVVDNTTTLQELKYKIFENLSVHPKNQMVRVPCVGSGGLRRAPLQAGRLTACPRHSLGSTLSCTCGCPCLAAPPAMPAGTQRQRGCGWATHVCSMRRAAVVMVLARPAHPRALPGLLRARFALQQVYVRGPDGRPRLLEGDGMSLAQHEVLPDQEIRVVRTANVADDDYASLFEGGGGGEGAGLAGHPCCLALPAGLH
jgi:hypothetical protein